MNEENTPISDGEKVAVLFLALILDALSIIPGIGTVVAIIGLLSIGVWSWIRLGKLPFTKKLLKYTTKRAFVFVIEALPIAQMFPGWTVMALMGFRQGGKSPTQGVVGALALATSLFLLPAKSLALELTYPSFLPLREGIQLHEMVEILFTSSLVLGVILAFISLIYAGFEYIVSGENAGKRNAARQHLIAVVIGITILLSSVIFLRLVNPNLVTIPPLVIDVLEIRGGNIVAGRDPAAEELGGNYSRLNLSTNISSLKNSLQKLQAEGSRGTLLESIASLMEECSPNLCVPGSTPYSKIEIVERSYESCGLDEDGNKDCDTFYETEPQCVPATCTGTSCSGAPLEGREGVKDTIVEASQQLDALASLFAQIESGQTTVASCGGNALSCVTSQVSGATSSCDPAQDFFCGISASPSASLPLRETAELESEFIENMKKISRSVLSASCGNTTFQCDGGCGEAVGYCTPSDAPSGCPAELFEAARELDTIAEEMGGHREDLVSIIGSADATLEASLQTGGEILLRSCGEAIAAITSLRESGVYSNGACSTETTCCPTTEVITALDQCAPVDLFICS